MAAILGSLVLAIVGLWIALSRGGTDMAMVGWMLSRPMAMKAAILVQKAQLPT